MEGQLTCSSEGGLFKMYLLIQLRDSVLFVFDFSLGCGVFNMNPQRHQPIYLKKRI